MSFFKDFKADFTQAMNELMPDGNEVYDEVDELLDEAERETSVEEKVPKGKKEKIKKEKKSPKIKQSNAKDKERLTASEDAGSVLRDEAVESMEDADIAPEDMLDQIDDLLDNELYGDNPLEAGLLNDDTEVNTMDMSLEDLLKQLGSGSVQSDSDSSGEEEPVYPETSPLPEQQPEEDQADEEYPVNEAGTAPQEDKDLDDFIDDLLMDLDKSSVHEEVAETDEPETMVENDINRVEPENEEPVMEKSIADLFQQIAEEEPEAEEVEELEEEPEDVEVEELEEEPEDVEVEELEEEPEAEEVEELEEEPEEVLVEEIEEYTSEDVNDGLKDATEQEEEISVEFYEDADSKPEVSEMTILESIENVEDNIMSEEKDVISINPVNDKEEKSTKQESGYNVENADSETTYITKGTVISGNLETDGSIDIIGTVNGDINCKGKVVVGGSVSGSVTAGELYCNSAKIEGDIKSYGSIKIGVGSMIIGNMEGESAVIAGAVNGDIDVKGPVIVDSTAVIMGNIKSRSVQINNGAVIEGFCSQSYSDIDVKSFFA